MENDVTENFNSLLVGWVPVDGSMSEWKAVTSAVPQECMLEPILFIVLISEHR